MDLINDQLEMMIATARRIAREKIEPLVSGVDPKGEFPWEMFEILRDQGFINLTIPEAYGGLGLNFWEAAMIAGEIARVDVVPAHIVCHQSMVNLPIIDAGTDKQKEYFLNRAAKENLLAAFALTEPHAGSDAGGIKASAVRKGDHFILNGTKQFVTFGSVADIICVFATTKPGKRHEGITAFLIEKGVDGLLVGKHEDKMGVRGLDTASLTLDELVVPMDNMLGAEGEGFKVAMRSLNMGRLGVGFMCVGLAQGSLDYALAYARERQQFGKPIVEFQAIQFILADMATKIEAARSLVYECSRLVRDRSPDDREIIKRCSMVKYFCSDMAMNATTDGLQVLGGYGYIKDYPQEKRMRDAKVYQIIEGTNQIQRIVVARELIKS
ncbi:MAG: acyl-CoA dehydrogenase family protein [Desulfatiglandales bacterium]